MKLITEKDQTTVALRRRLDAYYATTGDYTAFQQPSQVAYFWKLLLPRIQAVIARQGTCRILEFGAGRSGFALFLREKGLREKVLLTMHDVTASNTAWLNEQADEVQIGPVPAIRGRYDIIVSSFVLEHMTDPQVSLCALWSAVEQQGGVYVVCPRYDCPFYLPPACDHLSLFERAILAVKVMGARLRTVIRRKPAFLLLSDAAVFHLPFTKDRDAVHLVSWPDLRILFHSKQAKIERLRFVWVDNWRGLLTPGGLKAWFVTRFLLVGLAAERR